MKIGAFAPQEQMFHFYNILENLTFQRCGLIMNFNSFENIMENGAFAPYHRWRSTFILA